MARDEDDADGLPPIGEGTKDCLDDAKKGKPRSFLLIVKGVKVQYLKVKKKPIKTGEIAEAKKLGYKGEAYIGVITGSGQQLVFNLAISDGYESEPCKEKSLKDFMDEHAGFKSQPTFAIVPTPPEIPFEDDDLAHPLVARFLELVKLIPEALQKDPSAENELRTSSSQIRSLLLEGEYPKAEPLVQSFETRLRQLIDGGETQSSTSTGSDDALKNKLMEVFNKLLPQVKQAISFAPNSKQELLAAAADIKKHLDENRELDAAKKKLMALSGRVRDILAGDSGNQPSQDNQQQAGKTTGNESLPVEEVERLLLDVKRSFPNDAAKYQGVWDFIQNRISNGEIDKARTELLQFASKLREALAKKPTSDTKRFGIEEGTVQRSQEQLIEAFKKTKLVWAKTRESVQSQLKVLEDSILATCQSESDFDAIKANSGNVYAILDVLDEELIELLDDAIDESNAARQKLQHEQAHATVVRYLEFVRTDPFLQEVDSNPFTAVQVRSRLESTLLGLDKALQQRQLGG